MLDKLVVVHVFGGLNHRPDLRFGADPRAGRGRFPDLGAGPEKLSGETLDMRLRPTIWIPRRLSDATLERAFRDYDVIEGYELADGTLVTKRLKRYDL